MNNNKFNTYVHISVIFIIRIHEDFSMLKSKIAIQCVLRTHCIAQIEYCKQSKVQHLLKIN